MSMSKVEKNVVRKIRMRAAVGKSKYGVTMERNDLSFKEWIQHLQEELMDAVVYIEKLLGEGEKGQRDGRSLQGSSLNGGVR